jgi:uncharacterized membrane protein
MSGGNKLLVGTLVGIGIAAYAVLAHVVSTRSNGGKWAVAIALAPILLVAIGIVGKSARGVLPWLLLAGGVLLGLWASPVLEHNLGWMYFAQHVGLNAALGFSFGITLFGNRRPLCTVFAAMMQPEITPGLARYTRRVTLAWTLFFAGMVAVSVLLFFLAPIAVWSVFANILMMPLVILMFLIEYGVRRFALPPEERGRNIFEAFHAYRAATRADAPGRGPAAADRP